MIAVRDRLGGEMKKTLVGCLALLGEDARPSDGPVDIVIEARSSGRSARRAPGSQAAL